MIPYPFQEGHHVQGKDFPSNWIKWAFKKHHEILIFHFATHPGNAASLGFGSHMVEGERRHLLGWGGELARKERRLADGLGVTWKDTEGL